MLKSTSENSLVSLSDQRLTIENKPESFGHQLGFRARSLFSSSKTKEIEIIPYDTFNTFLTTKAAPQKKFGKQDHLKYRYVEMVTAQGAWNKFKAFMNLGGLGYFFAGKVNESNIDALKQESEFYSACSKVEACFQKFSGKPSAETLKPLKEAYEAVLALGADSSEHDLINTIININAKAESVGRTIIENDTKFALGHFTLESVLDTVDGQQFLNGIQSKADQGYRATITTSEKAVLKQALKNDIKQKQIIQILKDEHAGPLFVVVGREFVKQRDLNDQNKLLILNTVHDLVSNETIPEGEVERRIGLFNKRILEELENSDEGFSESALPLGFGDKVDAFSEMKKLYNNYKANLDKLPELDEAVTKADKADKKAQNELTAELKKTRECSLSELEQAYEGLKKEALYNLPKGAEYLDAIEQKDDLQQSLEQKNREIETRTQVLKGLVGEKGTLIAEKNELAEAVVQLKKKAENDKKLLDEAANNAQVVNKLKPTQDSTVSINESSDLIEAESASKKRYVTSNLAYTTTKGKLETKEQEIATAKADLQLLESVSSKHPLIKDKEGIVANLKVIETTPFVLSYDNIAEVWNNNKTTKIEAFAIIGNSINLSREAKLSSAEMLESAQGAADNMPKTIAEQLNALEEFGFEVDENQLTGKFSFAGFDEEYKQNLGKELNQRAPFVGKVILALGDVGGPVSADFLAKDKNVRKAVKVSKEVLKSSERKSLTSSTTLLLEDEQNKKSKRTSSNQKHEVEKIDLTDVNVNSDYESFPENDE